MCGPLLLTRLSRRERARCSGGQRDARAAARATGADRRLHPVCVDGADVIVIVCGVSSIVGSVNAHSPSYQLDRTSLVLLTTCFISS